MCMYGIFRCSLIMFRIEQWGPCCDVYLLWFVRIPSLKEIPLVEKIHPAYPNGKYPHHQFSCRWRLCLHDSEQI